MKNSESLKSIQSWFASIITIPLIENDKIDTTTKNQLSTLEEASVYIKPNQTMKPLERIEVYNQQYWWRLFNILQAQFPMLLRIFNYHDFNISIATPYLQAFPPNHYSLKPLGNNLYKWMKKHYQATDRAFVLKCAQLDFFYHRGFSEISDYKKQNNSKNTQDLALSKFRLSNHVSIIKYKNTLPEFRDKLLEKEPSWWIEHDFPLLDKSRVYHYVIFRNKNGYMHWKEISNVEYKILIKFKKKSTIEDACALLNETEQNQAFDDIQNWFKYWMESDILRFA
jgi:hypothetical protein